MILRRNLMFLQNKKIPANPKDEFIKIYNKYYKGIEDLAKIKNFGEVEILKGDA